LGRGIKKKKNSSNHNFRPKKKGGDEHRKDWSRWGRKGGGGRLKIFATGVKKTSKAGEGPQERTRSGLIIIRGKRGRLGGPKKRVAHR